MSVTAIFIQISCTWFDSLRKGINNFDRVHFVKENLQAAENVGFHSHFIKIVGRKSSSENSPLKFCVSLKPCDQMKLTVALTICSEGNKHISRSENGAIYDPYHN